MRSAASLSTRALGVLIGLLLVLASAGLPKDAAAQSMVLRTASQASVPFKYAPKDADRPGICIEVMHALMRIDPQLSFTGTDRELPLKRIEADLARTGELAQLRVKYGVE